MDARGVAAIRTLDPAGFRSYLDASNNTICGRHAISVVLEAVRASRLPFVSRFLRYCQSSRPLSNDDNAVSYAAVSLSSISLTGVNNTRTGDGQWVGAPAKRRRRCVATKTRFTAV
jgi:hypothetical protein